MDNNNPLTKAREHLRKAVASRAAEWLSGRLVSVPTSTLKHLKRELTAFDAQRGVWKKL